MIRRIILEEKENEEYSLFNIEFQGKIPNTLGVIEHEFSRNAHNLIWHTLERLIYEIEND